MELSRDQNAPLLLSCTVCPINRLLPPTAKICQSHLGFSSCLSTRKTEVEANHPRSQERAQEEVLGKDQKVLDRAGKLAEIGLLQRRSQSNQKIIGDLEE